MKMFFIGIISILVCYPILNSFADLVCALLEMIQTKISKIIAKDTIEMKRMAAEAADLYGDDEEYTKIIGFVPPELNEEDAENEEDEEDDDI